MENKYEICNIEC